MSAEITTGVSALPLPLGSYTAYLEAYDAGSEGNSESCQHVPGPPCSAHGVRFTDGAEGMIQVHSGILGKGDLNKAMLGWTGAVAKIRIEKL